MGSSSTRRRMHLAGFNMPFPSLSRLVALVFLMFTPGKVLAQIQDLTVALNGVTYSGVSASLLASQFPTLVQTINPAVPTAVIPPVDTDDDGDDEPGDTDDDDIAWPLPAPTSPIAPTVPVEPFTVTLTQTPTNAAGAVTGSPNVLTYTIGTAGANSLTSSSSASAMETGLTSSDLSNSARIGVGVGVGVGGAILLALLAFVGWSIYRRRKMQHHRDRLVSTNVPTYRGAELSPDSEVAEKDAEGSPGSNGGAVAGFNDQKKGGYDEVKGDVEAPRHELSTFSPETADGRVELPAREVPVKSGEVGGSLRSDV